MSPKMFPKMFRKLVSRGRSDRRSHRRSARRIGAGSFVAATVLILVALLFASPLLLSQNALSNNTAANLTEELPPGPMQAKATTSCLECHEARIILQQRLSKAAWTKELDKMVRWGAVLPEDRDGLIDYLSANFGPDKPPYEPPRSAPSAMQKTAPSKRKSK